MSWDQEPADALETSVLPEEFCPRWAQLKNAADQALSLIERGRGSGQVKFTDPSAAWQREIGRKLMSLLLQSHTAQTRWPMLMSWCCYKCMHTTLHMYNLLKDCDKTSIKKA